jgi:hypothetical protein
VGTVRSNGPSQDLITGGLAAFWLPPESMNVAPYPLYRAGCHIHGYR